MVREKEKIKRKPTDGGAHRSQCLSIEDYAVRTVSLKEENSNKTLLIV